MAKQTKAAKSAATDVYRFLKGQQPLHSVV